MKYQIETNIIDVETGEIIDLDRFSRELVDADFEEIVERVVALKQVLNQVSGLYRVNEYKFIEMMKDKEAKKYVNDEVEIRLQPQTNYDYDVNSVHKIKELIPEDDFNKIFTEQYKVNRNLLRTIYVLGGEIKQLIDQMETKNEKKPTVVVTSINKK